MHSVLFFSFFLCAFFTAYAGSANQPSQSSGNYCALNDVCKNLRNVQEKQKALVKKVEKHDEALAGRICSENSEGCKKFSISAVVHCTSAVQYRGESHFKLEALSADKNDMCRTFGKSIRTSASYSATVDLLNQAGWQGVDSGHLGLLYNAVDENNFDFVYFRPHSTSGCYQTGYMSKGNLNFLQSKACPSGPPRGGAWFEMSITVNGQDVQIFLNKDLVVTVKAHFPPMAWGGVFTFHGYQNVVLFRNFRLAPQLFVTQGCVATSDWSDYTMIDANHGTWPQDGFCRAIFVKEGGVEDYQVTVELFNFIGWNGVSSGHLGVLFNAQDENNFDFIYFRPHSVGGCFQTGYVFKGQRKSDGSKSGPCPHGPPKGTEWFRLQVEITASGKAKVFMNGNLVTSWTSRYPIKARGGVVVANGYQNVVYMRNFRLE